jgi:hypothetical protein
VLQGLCGVDTAETRHVEVENSDLGAELHADLHGLGAVRRLECRCDPVRVSEQCDELGPYAFVVVGDEHPDVCQGLRPRVV